MYRKFHDRFGSAGLVIAVIALIAALGGSAFAAGGGLSGKQKKEVKKIARSEAQKYANSNPGAAGKDGTNGTNGKDGTNGTPGDDGVSATTKAIPTSSPTCNHNGGIEVESASPKQNVCNGATGYVPFLPAGQSETGTWSVGATGVAAETLVSAPISFTIPLEVAGELNEGVVENPIPLSYVKPGDPATAACPGTAEAPEAAPGNLCVYQSANSATTFALEVNPENGESFAGTGRSGVVMSFLLNGKEAFARGVWVLSAPEP